MEIRCNVCKNVSDKILGNVNLEDLKNLGEFMVICLDCFKRSYRLKIVLLNHFT